jgi:hypothetical protein
MQHKRLVLDANILIRAVLGRRVRQLIADGCQDVAFYVAEANYDEAEHLHMADTGSQTQSAIDRVTPHCNSSPTRVRTRPVAPLESRRLEGPQMLKLFQSIFRPGADKLGTYPEDLIERAIERAIDALLLPLGHSARLL